MSNNNRNILNKGAAVASGISGMIFRPNQSNGARIQQANKVVNTIQSATGTQKTVRNMMPRTKTFTKRVELPLYMFLDNQGTLRLYQEINKTKEISLPLNGLEFTESEEYQDLSCEIDTLRLLAVGASVNFINTESGITPVNIFEKWMYGMAPQKTKAKYDSTWQPLDWEKKVAQQYKTFLPKTTEGYLTFYSVVAFTDTLRNLHYDMNMEVAENPASTTLIGTISLNLWVQCKRKNVIDFSHELQIVLKKKNDEIDSVTKENEELKRKLKTLIDK